MPRFNSISISGYHMQEAGATADLELGYTLADGLEYVRAAMSTRAWMSTLCAATLVLLRHRHELLHGDRQAPGGALLWATHHEAVRTTENPKSLMLRTHCQTSGWSLTAQDVYNNVIRTCDRGHGRHPRRTPRSLHTNSLDEALALPTDFSARIARNTQTPSPAGVGHTAAFGGRSSGAAATTWSRLTHALAREGPRHTSTSVEELGGMTKADRRPACPSCASKKRLPSTSGAHRPRGASADHRGRQQASSPDEQEDIPWRCGWWTTPRSVRAQIARLEEHPRGAATQRRSRSRR